MDIKYGQQCSELDMAGLAQQLDDGWNGETDEGTLEFDISGLFEQLDLDWNGETEEGTLEFEPLGLLGQLDWDWDGETEEGAVELDISGLFSQLDLDWDGETDEGTLPVTGNDDKENKGPCRGHAENVPVETTGDPLSAEPSTSKLFVEQPFNIFPVTVKQVRECAGSKVMVHGTEARVVILLGLAEDVSIVDFKIRVTLDDQTGSIVCMQYLNSKMENRYKDKFIPTKGTYVRVVGALKKSKGHNFLAVYKFFRVTDLNEMTAHILEVVQVEMNLKRLTENEEFKRQWEKRQIEYNGKFNYAEIVSHFGWMPFPKSSEGWTK